MKNNLTIKLMSFFFAFIIWVSVYNIYDPVISISKNIPIQILNEDSIKKINKVYTIDGDKSISFYIKGKQSIIKNIKDSDIIVSADLSRLSELNTVKVNIDIPKYNNIDVIYGKTDTLKIILDNYVSKTFDLKVNYDGKINDKYYLCNDNVNEKITISGSQQIINKISDVYINSDLTKLYPNYQNELEIKAKDSFNTNIDLTKLEIDKQFYIYKPTVYNVKTVPININLIDNVKNEYHIKSKNFVPNNVKISGTDELLNKTNNLSISYEVNNLSQNENIKIKIKDYLDDKNLYLVDNELEVSLNIKSSKYTNKTYLLSLSDISIKNMPQNMNISYTNNTDLYEVTITGFEEDLINLKNIDLNAYIDLKDLNLGKHNIEINVSNDKIKLIKTTSIEFELNQSIENKENFEKQETSEEETTQHSNEEETNNSMEAEINETEINNEDN